MIDPTEAYNRLVSLGEAWADKQAAADLLSESRKSVRAQRALHYLPAAKSVGKAELMAEADTIYVDHVASMIEASRAANKARVNYGAAKTYLELSRTQESTRRAEIQSLQR